MAEGIQPEAPRQQFADLAPALTGYSEEVLFEQGWEDPDLFPRGWNLALMATPLQAGRPKAMSALTAARSVLSDG
ncbi:MULTISPECIES: hypothetical protein [Streptomyces]|uniref:hypothetical protein n=1 Tax=Streptomyces TaxID=1883 RepID=UPI001EFC1A89|nr:hypothetical protein [Streptomyces sp. CL12-4]MCG8967778.1 hypothetical protein [Streptomyces sp. CL12-4]